jgi:hypothetical protein
MRLQPCSPTLEQDVNHARTVALIAAIALSGAVSASELGSVVLTYAGSGKTEKFVPAEGPFYKDLGMLKGLDQFSVGWRATFGNFGKSDYRMLAIATTAPKDGSAIQGMVLNYDRAETFALYQPSCVLNTGEKCDIRTVGVDLNVHERTITFKNAKFIGDQKADGFPDYVVVNGVLRY